VKDIAKQYPQLTADERFRLFVEAMGRKDEQELDRLEATCPRKHYTAQEDRYVRKKMRFTVFAFASALEAARMETFAMLALVVMLAANDDDGDEHAETYAKAIDVFKQLMRLRQGKRSGWLRFCRRLGVTPDAMTAPFRINMEWAMATPEAIAKSLDDSADGDPSEVEEIATKEFDALLDAWGDAI